MDLYFRHGDEVATVRVEPESSPSAQAWRVRVGERWLHVELRREEGGRLELLVDGRPVRAHVARAGLERWVQLEGGAPAVLERVDSARPRRGSQADGKDALVADTPAQVVSLRVGLGDAVRHGDTLIVLEAMKMEFRLTAPHDGHVTAIHCKPGEVVERGRILMEVEVEA